MSEFHRGPYETAVGDGQMLTEIRLPLHDHAGSAYEKVERRAGDWAVAAAGASIWMDGANIGDAGIGLAAVGAPDMRSARAEEALRGQPPSEELFAEAGRLAAEECNPTTDQRGSEEYKRHLAQELTIRAVRRAVERALT
jgi:carbon-monoxide dehydrogenase medium subunit